MKEEKFEYVQPESRDAHQAKKGGIRGASSRIDNLIRRFDLPVTAPEIYELMMNSVRLHKMFFKESPFPNHTISRFVQRFCEAALIKHIDLAGDKEQYKTAVSNSVNDAIRSVTIKAKSRTF